MYAVTEAPEIGHTSALNAAFDARWMIAGTRLLAVVATGYLLASIVVRVHRGQWVRSAGSLEADTPTQDVVDDQEDLQEQLRVAQATIADLEEQLAQSRSMIQALSGTVGGSRAATDRGLSGGAEDADGTNT